MSRPEAARAAGPARPQSGPRPAGTARRPNSYGRSPVAPRPRTPSGPARSADARSAGARPRPSRVPTTTPGGLRLTGRGAILGLFLLMFLGLLLSGWLGTGILADVLFLLGCAAMGWYTKPSDLLSVSISPPLAFFCACLLAKLITSSGGTSAAEGILVTLATSAPWLFAGTALTIVIALRRGLLDNIRELRQSLQGTPAGKLARADERERRR